MTLQMDEQDLMETYSIEELETLLDIQVQYENYEAAIVIRNVLGLLGQAGYEINYGSNK